ncbi:antibiotic biosynthesis monooxygenase family protein [Streptomyces sp. NPDC001668]|uniref:antibiotic biosynthesis monooxygenase family protein n=1 Tax=unclassified Streptomyces TaxID=2593676 RepID=UPI003409E0CE
MTATITKKAGLFTIINVATTTPENQSTLFEAVSGLADRMKNSPGFVSASVHRSHDGTRIIGYAQWESKEHFEAMRARTDLGDGFKVVRELTSDFLPITCQVAYTHDGE